MKIYLDSVGCRLNQSEIDRFARQILLAGHEVVARARDADLAIINTCAVTRSAESDSRQKSRNAARAGAKQVVITGCWASLQPQAAASLPNVTGVRENLTKDRLIEDLLPVDPEGGTPLLARWIPGETTRTRAFIKVQDGCDNHCSFCVTTLARGKNRTYSVEHVLDEVNAAFAAGHQEIVLTGVQLGAWGKDLRPRAHLKDLLQAILDSTPVPRIRLSSVEPWDLSPEFFALWGDSRLCPHLHLPLQSGSARTLRRMKRRTSPAAFRELMREARRAIPGLALTTDIIVGFPGEDDRDFEESLRFVKEIEFAGGHVFSYSPRPGTAAAAYPDQVPPNLIRDRSRLMREALVAGEKRFRSKHRGTEVQVLWEGAPEQAPGGWLLHGWSQNHLRVQAHSQSRRTNQIEHVRLGEIRGKFIQGAILSKAKEAISD